MLEIFELQLDFWIPLLMAFLTGVFTALGTGLANAMKPRFETDTTGNNIEIEKERIVTKAEWLEIGNLCWQGGSYALVIAIIIMILQLTPLQTQAFLWVVFGLPLSIQFTAVTCGFIGVMIFLGLHAKAWKQGGFLFVASTTFINKVKAVGEQIDDKTSKIVGNVISKVETVATKTLDGALSEMEVITGNLMNKIDEQVNVLGKQAIESPVEPTKTLLITCPKCLTNNISGEISCKQCGYPLVSEVEVHSTTINEEPKEETKEDSQIKTL